MIRTVLQGPNVSTIAFVLRKKCHDKDGYTLIPDYIQRYISDDGGVLLSNQLPGG